MNDLSRRLVAEMVGTGLLVLFGAGAAVSALTLGDGSLDYAGLGMIALSFGIVVAVVIYAFGATSGAHINPAVTFSLAVVRRFPWKEVAPYMIAQLVGATAGGLLIVASYGTAAVGINSVGAAPIGEGVSFGSALLAEALGTWILVTAIMATAVDPRAPKGWAGLIIGLSVATAILVFGPVTGASINPARNFGPYLAATLAGGTAPWGDFLLFVLGPLVGGAGAALTYDLVARPRLAAESAQP